MEFPGQPMNRLLLPVGLLCAATSHPVLPDEPEGGDKGKHEFSAEVRVGGEYDANVTVEEVNMSSGRGDYAALLGGQLEYKRKFGGGTDWSLSYDASQTLYDELSDLNRQTHILSTDVKVELAEVNLGASYHYVNSQLDGDDFLTLNRTSPYFSTFLSRQWFVRVAYVYTDKEVMERPERDANTGTGEADLYWFRSGLRSYFNLGYRYKDENARGARFDHRSNSLKLRYVQRFELFGRLAKLELAGRLEDRDYSSITPSIGEERDEQRYRVETELEIPVLGDAAVVLYHKYSDYDSNLERSNYSRHVAGARFLYRWN